MFPQYVYNQILLEVKLQTLEERRDDFCVFLVKNLLHPSNKLPDLLPKKLVEIKERDTTANGERIYGFVSKTD